MRTTKLTAMERQEQILRALSARRQDTIKHLAAEFAVTERTIRSDIEKLSCSYPIYTVQGNGGGVYVDDGWRITKTYLTKEQSDLLERLRGSLDGTDLAMMDSILLTFGNPKYIERSKYT